MKRAHAVGCLGLMRSNMEEYQTHTHESGRAPHKQWLKCQWRKAEKLKSKHKHGFTFKAISHGCAFNLCGKSIDNNNTIMIRIAGVVVVVDDVPWALENLPVI